MSMRTALIASIGGLALAFVSSSGANAVPISATFNQPLSTLPITVSFNGASGFTFFAAATGYGPGAAVATTGTGTVTSLFGSVTDFEAGATIDQTAELYTFAASPAPTPIQYSAADDFIGLALTLVDGVHYGYAEIFGSNLIGVGFESAANTSILTGATGTGTGIRVATPEPASIALVVTGLVVLSARRRRDTTGGTTGAV